MAPAHQAEARRGRTNLARRSSSFVGRAALEEQVVWALERGRVVTLLGPAGAGKTRLAEEVALARVDAHVGGAWFCDLSECRDVHDVCTVLSEVLRIGLPDRHPVERIGRALAVRGDLLLVLDRFEHLVEHAEATVGVWAALAPSTQLLVTSRAQLRVDGELVVAVEPLRRADGVALLAARAAVVRPDFTLAPEDERAAMSLVEDLDGLPLAIEISAARAGLLGPGSLRSLGSGAGGSLQGALEAAWDALDPLEQSALAQLSVFAGPFDPRAAEAVVSVPGRPASALLQSLCDRSLVAGVPGERPGLRLHGAVREFAAARLSVGDSAGLRHARHVLERAEALAVSAEERPVALAELSAHMADLAAIRGRYRGHPAHRLLSARAGLAQAPAWMVRGPLATLERVMAEVLPDALGARELEFRARMLHAEAVAVQGRLDGATGLLLAILGDAREAEDEHASARALRMLAVVRSMQGSFEESGRLAEQARSEFQWVGEARDAAHVLCEHGQNSWRAGDLERALELLSAGIEELRGGDWPRSLAARLPQLAALHLERGEVDEGTAAAAEALELARSLGEEWIEGRALRTLADLCTRRGDLEGSRVHLERAALRVGRYGAVPTELLLLGQIVGLDEAAGRLDLAEEGWRRLVRRCEDLGFRRQEAVYRGRLGSVLARLGRTEEAHRELVDAATALEEMGLSDRGARLRDQVATLLLGGIEP